jgi:hypothetical protein
MTEQKSFITLTPDLVERLGCLSLQDLKRFTTGTLNQVNYPSLACTAATTTKLIHLSKSIGRIFELVEFIGAMLRSFFWLASVAWGSQ